MQFGLGAELLPREDRFEPFCRDVVGNVGEPVFMFGRPPYFVCAHQPFAIRVDVLSPKIEPVYSSMSRGEQGV